MRIASVSENPTSASRCPEPVPVFILLVTAACAAGSAVWRILTIAFIALVNRTWDPANAEWFFTFLLAGIVGGLSFGLTVALTSRTWLRFLIFPVAGGFMWMAVTRVYWTWVLGYADVPKSPMFWVMPRMAADLVVPLSLLVVFEIFMRKRAAGAFAKAGWRGLLIFSAGGAVAGLGYAALLLLLAPPGISLWVTGRFVGHALEEAIRFSLVYGGLCMALALDARHKGLP